MRGSLTYMAHPPEIPSQSSVRLGLEKVYPCRHRHSDSGEAIVVRKATELGPNAVEHKLFAPRGSAEAAGDVHFVDGRGGVGSGIEQRDRHRVLPCR